MKWSYGVTTVPARFEELLHPSKAGFFSLLDAYKSEEGIEEASCGEPELDKILFALEALTVLCKSGARVADSRFLGGTSLEFLQQQIVFSVGLDDTAKQVWKKNVKTQVLAPWLLRTGNLVRVRQLQDSLDATKALEKELLKEGALPVGRPGTAEHVLSDPFGVNGRIVSTKEARTSLVVWGEALARVFKGEKETLVGYISKRVFPWLPRRLVKDAAWQRRKFFVLCRNRREKNFRLENLNLLLDRLPDECFREVIAFL